MMQSHGITSPEPFRVARHAHHNPMQECKTSIHDAPEQSCAKDTIWRKVACIAAAIVAIVAAILWLDVPLYRAVSVPCEHMVGISTLNSIALGIGSGVGLILGPIVLLVAARKYWRYVGLTYLCAFLTQTVLTDVIKTLTGRNRPNHALGDPLFYGMHASQNPTFPSGHASFTFMIATIAAAYFPRWRWWFYSIASFVAIGRVTANRHFFGDVLAGALLGYLVSRLFLAIWPVPDNMCQTPAEPAQQPPAEPEHTA